MLRCFIRALPRQGEDMPKLTIRLLLVAILGAVAGVPPASLAQRNGSEEFAKKYLPHRGDNIGLMTAHPCKLCELDKQLLSDDAKENPSKYARRLSLLVLLKTMEAKELIPDFTNAQGTGMQRNIFKAYIAKNPNLTKDFALVDGLKTIELALGNYDEYDRLFALNVKNHPKKLQTDLICYSFLHKAYLPAKRLQKSPAQALADLSAQHESCQQSKAITFFKTEAQKRFRCLKAIGRPFASYEEYEKLYRGSTCR